MNDIYWNKIINLPPNNKQYRGVVPKEGHKVVAYLCFTVTLRTSKLKLFPYSQKQNNLYKKIKSLRRNGLTFVQIAVSLIVNKITTIRG